LDLCDTGLDPLVRFYFSGIECSDYSTREFTIYCYMFKKYNLIPSYMLLLLSLKEGFRTELDIYMACHPCSSILFLQIGLC